MRIGCGRVSSVRPFEPGHALGDGPLDLARADERGRVHADEVGDVGPEDLGVGRVARQECAVEADRGNGGRGAPEVGVEATLRGRGLSIRGHASLSDGMHHDLTNFGGAPEPARARFAARGHRRSVGEHLTRRLGARHSLAISRCQVGAARSLGRRARKGRRTMSRFKAGRYLALSAGGSVAPVIGVVSAAPPARRRRDHLRGRCRGGAGTARGTPPTGSS